MQIALNDSLLSPAATGSTYKLVVRSAEEAVATIRERFGGNARVLSVRQIPGLGLAGLLGRPRLEVIAQLTEAEASAAATPAAPAPVAAPLASAERAPAVSRDQPAGLGDLPRRSGFSAALIGRIEASPSLAGHERRPLHRVLVDVGSTLGDAVRRLPRAPLPSRAAFIGSPGCGRTTALCKWLSREVFARDRSGRVFKSEFDRPNPCESLGVFCEALGLSLEHSPEGEPVAVEGDAFAYEDTPAISVASPAANGRLLRHLDASRVGGRVLVLNALYDPSLLRDTYAAGRDLGATHVVFTHLDELVHWGRLWDFLVDGGLSPLFLSTGPGLSGDILTDVVGAVMRRTLPGVSVPPQP